METTELEGKTTTAIAEYSKTEAALADLSKRFKDAVYDVTKPEGLMEAKKGRAEIRGIRVALENKRVEIKEPALARCQLIDAEARRITRELSALEDPIDAQTTCRGAGRERASCGGRESGPGRGRGTAVR